jgi:FAD/FMN-containing dehydrogenase
MCDKRPALIVRCAGVSDIIRSVNFARTNSIPVAVRGGGHNVSGSGACDGGLMLDMSRLKSVRVDPVSHTARAEPGLTWGEWRNPNYEKQYDLRANCRDLGKHSRR